MGLLPVLEHLVMPCLVDNPGSAFFLKTKEKWIWERGEVGLETRKSGRRGGSVQDVCMKKN